MNVRGIVCVALAWFASSVSAQAPITAHPPVPIGVSRQKTTDEVIRLAKAGVSQKLIVSLEAEDIYERERQKRAERGLSVNDAQIQKETIQELKALKAAVFPSGRWRGVIVTEDFDAFPTVSVQVPDFASLIILMEHPRVKSIQGNDRMYPSVSQSFPLIGQPAAVAAGELGTNFRVAVIDSGVDLNYTDWSADGKSYCRFNVDSSSPYYRSSGPYIGSAGCRIAHAIDFSGATATTGGWNLYDRSGGHGTNVAGIVTKLAPGSKIDVLQVFDASGVASRDAIIRALNWVFNNAAVGPGKIIAVNLSFGGSASYAASCTSSAYADPLRALRNIGIMPVVSSGNAGFTSGLPEPSCAPSAVSVGSVYDSNFTYDLNWSDGAFRCQDKTPRADQVVCSSNSSSQLTMLAPGAMIFSVGTASFGGTSQAAPHVAGALMVLREAFPSDSPEDTLARLTSTGKTVSDPKNGLKKPRLNVSAALASANVAGSSGAGSAGDPTIFAAVLAVSSLLLV